MNFTVLAGKVSNLQPVSPGLRARRQERAWLELCNTKLDGATFGLKPWHAQTSLTITSTMQILATHEARNVMKPQPYYARCKGPYWRLPGRCHRESENLKPCASALRTPAAAL